MHRRSRLARVLVSAYAQPGRWRVTVKLFWRCGFLGWLSIAGCLFGLPDLQEDIALTCTSSTDCPNDLSCVLPAGLCARPGAACLETNGDELSQLPDGNACTRDYGGAGVCVAGECEQSICGDGLIDTNAGEVCDDGNTDPTDACVACVPASCGDGAVRFGAEVCDDGNRLSGDGCRADCLKLEECGDTIVDEGEECDDATSARQLSRHAKSFSAGRSIAHSTSISASCGSRASSGSGEQ